MPYILKKKIKGRTYYYLAETKRVNGKPRIVWQKYLGTVEKIQARLQGAEISRIETFELGSVAAVESIEREIGFREIVDSVVNKRAQGMSVGQYLYLIVLNRIIEPKSKASLGAWLKKTAIHEFRDIDRDALESANFWDHMDKVRAADIQAIGDEVARKVVSLYDVSLDCLLYDTTNFFTQMSSATVSDLARHAHSKAGKHELHHVGLALLCNREDGIPLFHRLYPAQVQDSKLLFQIYAEMADLLRALRKKEHLTMVFDKGYNSPENIARIDDILAESHIAHVFDVQVTQDNGYRMSIRTRPQVLKDHRARFGKNIIFTDHTDWSTEDIVRAYRDRYKIETAFRQTKSPDLIRWQPMYHWTDSKIRVHGLTCVMALLYLALIHRKMRRAGLTMGLDRAMETLRGIRRAVYHYPGSAQPVRKLCRLDSTERELLTALDLDPGAI